MTKPFTLYIGTRVRFGIGTRFEIPNVLRDQKWKHAAIVVDHGLQGIDRVEEIIEAFKEELGGWSVIWNEVSEPTYKDLEIYRKELGNEIPDVVIGVGGGSTLDLAKGLSVLATNSGPAIRYRGFNQMTELTPPIVAVPTTAGTGSEVTPNASFVDSDERRKMGINGEAVRPSFAFLDPELTLTCPRFASVSAGVDGLVHATEAYVAKATNPVARVFSEAGMRQIIDALPKVVTDLENTGWRSEVMLGAFFAGLALMHSGTGPAAALSYPLGVHFSVPHGIAGGIFLPYVIERNIAKDYFGYGDFIVGQHDRGDEEAAHAFLDKLRQVWNDLDIPVDLKAYGVTRQDLPKLVKETLDLGAAIGQNPVNFTESDLYEIYEKLV